MKISDHIKCINFPCIGIDVNGYIVPGVEINPQDVRIFMITEAPPNNKEDYFYAKGNPFYLQTIIQTPIL
jgi:hypothetical protein